MGDAFTVSVALVQDAGFYCAQATLRCNVRVGDSVLLKGKTVNTHGMHFTIHTIDALENLLQMTAEKLGEREGGL